MKIGVIADQFIVSGCRFLLSVLIARALGVADFGVFALMWTGVAIAGGLQVPITITPIMQLGPKIAVHRRSSLLGTGVLLNLCYSIALIPFITIATLVIVWNRDDAFLLVIAVNLYIFSFSLFEFLRRYKISLGFYWNSFLLASAQYSISLLVVGFCFVSGELSIFSYLILTSIPALVLSIISLIKTPSIKWEVCFPIVRRFKNIAIPLFFSTLAGLVSGYGFVYSTAVFLGKEDVGGINAIRNILGPLAVLLIALDTSLTRDLVLLGKIDKERMRKYSFRMSLIWCGGFIIIALGLNYYSELLILYTYGQDFVDFSPLIFWFGAASVCQVCARVQTVRLRTEGKYEVIKRANIYTMIVMILIPPFLIYLIGLQGVGISVVLNGISLIIFNSLVERVLTSPRN